MYAEQRGRFQLSPRQDRRVQSLAVTGIAVWSRLCAVVPCRVTRDTHTSHDSTPSPRTLGASGFPPARPAALTCCASGVDDSLFGLRDSRPESRARLPVSPRESRSSPQSPNRKPCQLTHARRQMCGARTSCPPPKTPPRNGGRPRESHPLPPRLPHSACSTPPSISTSHVKHNLRPQLPLRSPTP
jgi:hypothetical protein